MIPDTSEPSSRDPPSAVSALKRFASRFIRGLSVDPESSSEISRRSVSPRQDSPRSHGSFFHRTRFTSVFRKPNTSKKIYKTSHRNALSDALCFMYDTEQLCDISVVSSENEHISAHKCLLASQSVYLRKLIENSQAGEQKEGVETISLNFASDVLRKVIGFMYSGRIELCDADVIDVFLAASMLMIEELKVICETHVSSAISCDSLQILLESSRELKAKELERKCIEFFENNVAEIVSTDAMLNMPKPLLRDLLCRDFYIADEYAIFEIVIRWGKHYRRNLLHEKRISRAKNMTVPSLKEILSDVVPLVRLIAVSVEDLERRVFPEKVLDNDIAMEVLFRKLQHGLVLPPKISGAPSPDALDVSGAKVKYYLMKRTGKWRKLTDFENEEEYVEYMKSVLRPGMLILATNTYEQVERGDIGRFVQHNSGIPPCQVTWQRYGNTYWLYFRDIQIID